MSTRRTRRANAPEDAGSWGLDEGDPIVPGRHAVRLLGGGRRHEAYLAWDDRLFGLVVAKILRPGVAADAGALEALAAEARALDRLDHPVLLRGFGAVLDGERPHLVLEFLEGPRLSTLLRKYGVLAVEQLLPLGVQLCSALHYMSTEDMVHLDVKPRNVIMAGPPRLVDLSIARSVEEARRTRGAIGTDAYMAPEQCGTEGASADIGPATDVWGLGVTLYEGLTGRLPFPSSDPSGAVEERFPQLVHVPTPLPPDVPAVLADPILACLAFRPTDRPTAAELGWALEPLADAVPSRPTLGRLRPRRRR